MDADTALPAGPSIDAGPLDIAIRIKTGQQDVFLNQVLCQKFRVVRSQGFIAFRAPYKTKPIARPDQLTSDVFRATAKSPAPNDVPIVLFELEYDDVLASNSRILCGRNGIDVPFAIEEEIAPPLDVLVGAGKIAGSIAPNPHRLAAGVQSGHLQVVGGQHVVGGEDDAPIVQDVEGQSHLGHPSHGGRPQDISIPVQLDHDRVVAIVAHHDEPTGHFPGLEHPIQARIQPEPLDSSCGIKAHDEALSPIIRSPHHELDVGPGHQESTIGQGQDGPSTFAGGRSIQVEPQSVAAVVDAIDVDIALPVAAVVEMLAGGHEAPFRSGRQGQAGLDVRKVVPPQESVPHPLRQTGKRRPCGHHQQQDAKTEPHGCGFKGITATVSHWRNAAPSSGYPMSFRTAVTSSCDQASSRPCA